MQSLEEKIKAIIVDRLGVDPQDVVSEAKLSDFSADSLDIAELVMTFEKEFDLAISDSDMEAFVTVGGIIKYVSDHKPELR